MFLQEMLFVCSSNEDLTRQWQAKTQKGNLTST